MSLSVINKLIAFVSGEEKEVVQINLDDTQIDKVLNDGKTLFDKVSPSEVADELLASKNYIYNKQNLRKFFKNYYKYAVEESLNYIGIAYYGDSISNKTAGGFTEQLEKFAGGIGADQFPPPPNAIGSIPQNVVSGTIRVASLTDSTDQTIYDGSDGGRDFRYDPAGSTTRFEDGAVFLLGYNSQSSGYIEARSYFVGDVGLGSVLIEVLNEAEDTVLYSETIDCNQASATMLKSTLTMDKNTKHRVRYTATGNIILIRTMFMREKGIIPVPFGLGGSTLAQNNYCDDNIFTLMLNEFYVNLIFIEAKEENYDTDIAITLEKLNNISNASTIVCGSSPDIETTESQILKNDIWFKEAYNRGLFFFDKYKFFEDYATLQSVGMEGDGVHLENDASFMSAMYLHSEIGLTTFFPNINLKKGRINNLNIQDVYLDLGANNKTPTKIIDAYGGGDPFGINISKIRQLLFDVNEDDTEYCILEAYGQYGINLKKIGGTSTAVLRVPRLEISDTSQSSFLKGYLQCQGNVYIYKELRLANGGYLKSSNGLVVSERGEVRPYNVTSANISDLTHSINTEDLLVGKTVFNTTDEALYCRLSNGTWKSMLDGSIITPV